MKKIASLVLSFLALVFSAQLVFAQTGNLNAITLMAIPPRLGDAGEIKVKPGEKFQTTVRITNKSDTELAVESFAQDFVIGEDGTTPLTVKEDVTNKWRLSSWLTLSPNNTVLAPKETGIISVLIEVPEDALPGGHYAIITHQPGSGGQTDPKGNSNTGVTQRVGTILYVTVLGDVKESAFVHDFKFKPDIAEFGPMHFFFSVENQSDIHIRPQVSVDIYNLFKQRVATVQVEPSNVFPLSQRAFSGVWPVSWGFGPYKADLTMTYGTNAKVVTASTTVWLLPLSVIIAVLIVILALITGGIVIKRHLAYRAELERREAALEEKIEEKEQEKSHEEG